MTRDDLTRVLRMAKPELDAMRNDGGFPLSQMAYKAVKAFVDNDRSTWMVPAARGVDAVDEGPRGPWHGE